MHMKKWAAMTAAVLALGLAVSGCGTSSQTSNTNSGSNAKSASGSKTVTIGWLGWTEDVAVTHLWKDILEQQGYTVNLKQLDVGPMFVGMSQNNVNLFMDAWLPTDKTYVDKYQSKLTSLGVWYTGQSNQGIAVPKYMTNINTMQDLNNHASEFNDTIVGIEPGSQEDQLVKKMINVYGMSKMQLHESSTPAMLSSLQRAVQQKKPVAVVMWTPHWAYVKYDLKFLKDPKKILAGNSSITLEANKSWAQNNPQVAKWLKNFKMNAKQLASLEEAVKGKKDMDAAAKTWISSHQSLVNSWLNG